MPQELYWVREKESGQPFQMHSVDAAEGMALGDYELITDPEKDLKPEERQAARSAMASPGAFPHPNCKRPNNGRKCGAWPRNRPMPLRSLSVGRWASRW
jgi:hypothetical protein